MLTLHRFWGDQISPSLAESHCTRQKMATLSKTLWLDLVYRNADIVPSLMHTNNTVFLKNNCFAASFGQQRTDTFPLLFRRM